jgi:arylsulfatase A-like enzyme
MKAYFRMISGYDQVMNRVLEVLKDKGLDQNTVIIFSSDNGYYMGNRGFAGKWTHYDESLRVPLIIYDPRTSTKDVEKTSDKLVLNIDIPSTILNIAGVETPQIHQGKSLLPLIYDEIETWRESFLIEHRMEHDKIPKYVGIHEKRYVYAKYYEQSPPYEYLHDLENDPDQLKNLINDPNYIEVLQNMRSKSESLENEIKNN